MPLFQRHPDGVLTRRTILSDGTGSGGFGSSPDATADCCCEIPPLPAWHSIIPCSVPLPSDPLATICCDGDGTECGWIDEATYCQILQDAIDAGDLDAVCVQTTNPCGLTWDGSRDSSHCDLVTPDYLVLWNSATQSCWRLYLRDPDGTGSAFGRACRTAYTTDPATPPGDAADYSDFVGYNGIDCVTAAGCDTDSDGNPDPPFDPPTTADNTTCGCDGNGSTGAIATVNVTACPCLNLGATSYLIERLNQTVALFGGPCSYTGEYRVKLTVYSDGTCTTVSSVSFHRAFVTATLSGGQWSASVFVSGVPAGGGSIFATAAADGDCAGGSPANSYVTCSAVVNATGGTVTIVAGGLP